MPRKRRFTNEDVISNIHTRIEASLKAQKILIEQMVSLASEDSKLYAEVLKNIILNLTRINNELRIDSKLLVGEIDTPLEEDVKPKVVLNLPHNNREPLDYYKEKCL